MSSSPILNRPFSSYQEWEAYIRNSELNPTVDAQGGVSIPLPNGSSIFLEELASHVNDLYRDLVGFYNLESGDSYSQELRLEERRQAILRLR